MVMEVIDDEDSKLVHYNIRHRECTHEDMEKFKGIGILSDFMKVYQYSFCPDIEGSNM